MANPKLTDSDSNDFEFLVLVGSDTVSPLAERVIPGGRAGVDGHDYTLAGQSATPFSVQTISDTETKAEAVTLIAAYKAFQGTLMTYTDEHLNAWTNVIVLAVLCGMRLAPYGTGILEPAGQSNYIVEAAFVMALTTDS